MDDSQAEYDELLTRALRLPVRMRLDFAEQLTSTLDEEHPLDISSEWAAEIDRRMKEVEDGSVELLDGEEVMRELEVEFARETPAPPKG